MTYKFDKVVVVVSLLLLFVSILIVLSVYSKIGLGWDFTDIYLTGKTLLNPAFYQQHLPVNDVFTYTTPSGTFDSVAYLFVTSSHIYFSLVREPLVPLFLALIMLISSTYAVQIYLILLLVSLLASSFFVSKQLDINPLLLSALLFSPYVLQWTVFYTSQEILSIVLALILVGLLAKKSIWAGGLLLLLD